MSEDATQELPIDLLRLILLRLDGMDQRLDRMDQRLDRMDQRLDRMEQRLDTMEHRIETLEARAYDTKPIWERALAELIELSKRVDNLDRRFQVLTDDVIQNRADFRKFDQRLADLEQPPRA